MIDAKGADAPAILKLIIAVLNGIAFHIDGFAILPPFGRQIVPKPLAPHDEQIGMQPVEDGEKRHDMPELSALLNGTFHRSVNAAGGLGELERRMNKTFLIINNLLGNFHRSMYTHNLGIHILLR